MTTASSSTQARFLAGVRVSSDACTGASSAMARPKSTICGSAMRQHEADQQRRVDLPERGALELAAPMQRQGQEAGAQPDRRDDEGHQRALRQHDRARRACRCTLVAMMMRELAASVLRRSVSGRPRDRLGRGGTGLSAKQRVEEATHY